MDIESVPEQEVRSGLSGVADTQVKAQRAPTYSRAFVGVGQEREECREVRLVEKAIKALERERRGGASESEYEPDHGPEVSRSRPLSRRAFLKEVPPSLEEELAVLSTTDVINRTRAVGRGSNRPYVEKTAGRLDQSSQGCHSICSSHPFGRAGTAGVGAGSFVSPPSLCEARADRISGSRWKGDVLPGTIVCA